jgi:isopenicillin-N N-acyltransferase-like protein
MRHFPVIDISGSTPYDCGKQYGGQAKQLIRDAIGDYGLLFAETSDIGWDEIARYALSNVPLIVETMPDLLEEAQGIADGAEVALGDIMVLNCRYEFTKFPKAKECTTGAVLPEAAKDGKMYLVKNWDYRVGIIDHIVALRIVEPDGNTIVGLTEAGQLLRDGMNSHGIALVSNNLQSIFDARGAGIPSCFLRRRILKCRSFEEGMELILGFKRAVSCNMMLASGTERKAVDFEVHPRGTDPLRPEGGVMTHANHFIAHPEIHALSRSPRGDRLRELLMERHGAIDVEHFKRCFSDHANYPQALCRHPDDASLRLGRRSSTVACEIFDLDELVLHVCAGPPCENEFQTIGCAES